MQKTIIYLMNVLQTRKPICGMSMEGVLDVRASINDIKILEDVRDNGYAAIREVLGNCCLDRRLANTTMLEWCRGCKVSMREERTTSMYPGRRCDDGNALPLSLKFVSVQLTYLISKPRWSFDAQKKIQKKTRPAEFPLKSLVYLS